MPSVVEVFVVTYFPCNSSAMRAPSYIFRSASVIAVELTLTERATSSVKMNRFGSDSMLPFTIVKSSASTSLTAVSVGVALSAVPAATSSVGGVGPFFLLPPNRAGQF